jgi:hypothetical protein
MMNPTELDTRFMSHASRIKHADQFGSLYPATRHTSDGQRAIVAMLRRWLPARPGPAQQARPSAANDTVTA